MHFKALDGKKLCPCGLFITRLRVMPTLVSRVRRCAKLESSRSAEERLVRVNLEMKRMKQARDEWVARLENIMERAKCASNFDEALTILDEVEAQEPPMSWAFSREEAVLQNFVEGETRREMKRARSEVKRLRDKLQQQFEARSRRSEHRIFIERLEAKYKAEDFMASIHQRWRDSDEVKAANCSDLVSQTSAIREEDDRRATVRDCRAAAVAANAALNRIHADDRRRPKSAAVASTDKPAEAYALLRTGRTKFVLRQLHNTQRLQSFTPPFAVNDARSDLCNISHHRRSRLPQFHSPEYSANCVSFRRKAARWYYD